MRKPSAMRLRDWLLDAARVEGAQEPELVWEGDRPLVVDLPTQCIWKIQLSEE